MDPLALARLQRAGLSCARSPRPAFPPSPRAVRGSPPPRTGSPPSPSSPRPRRDSLELARERLELGWQPPRTSNPPSPRQRLDSLARARLERAGLSCDDPPYYSFPLPPSAVQGSSRSPSPPADPLPSIVVPRRPQASAAIGDSSIALLEELQRIKQQLSERTGLCIICQDEEAIMAVVDCGHLAMCRECSDVVMRSSRKCPLCRKSIAEARLIRIFKT